MFHSARKKCPKLWDLQKQTQRLDLRLSENKRPIGKRKKTNNYIKNLIRKKSFVFLFLLTNLR